jgi:Putative adhesin
MFTYSTPAPIDLVIDLRVGGIEIIASDRTDTVITISARNAGKSSGRRSAEERTAVEFDGHRLTVTGPRPRPRSSVTGPSEADSVNVKAELPAGSRFTGEIGVGGLRTVGRLGATKIKSTHGAVDVDTTGGFSLRTSRGAVTVGAAEGDAEITSDSGRIRIGTVTGSSRFRATHGSIHVGEAAGDLDATLSYGGLEVTRATASVTAKIQWGAVELGEVSSGAIRVESGLAGTIGAQPSAPVTIGVRPGVPAQLDLDPTGGQVRNDLAGDRPLHASEPGVAIRVRSRGDITIRTAQGARS